MKTGFSLRPGDGERLPELGCGWRRTPVSLDFPWPLASPRPVLLPACLAQAAQAALGLRRQSGHGAALSAERGGSKERKTGGGMQRNQAQDLTNRIGGLALRLGLYPTLPAGRTWLIL